ncbi:MAG TPA: hypothetical protein VJ890_22370, partial [Vineibacter sp.]|nr:hypothetical protein [Vineibacter sp.]
MPARRAPRSALTAEVAFRRAACSPLGAIVARPWIDPVALGAMRRWFFPLSRLWAAANAAEGDIGRFLAQPGVPTGGTWGQRMLGPILRRHESARRRAAEARVQWEAAAFGTAPIEAAALAELDAARRRAASLHLATRGLFYPLLLPRRPPLAAWSMPTPAKVEAAYGAGRADPSAIYAVPAESPTIELSQAACRPGVTERWLRFVTPHAPLRARAGCGQVYARVVEPDGLADDAPTVIAGNGLCVESDILVNTVDPGSVLSEVGLRVVDVVSPYHGLRAQVGSYGGEPFFAAAPLGTLDLIVG